MKENISPPSSVSDLARLEYVNFHTNEPSGLQPADETAAGAISH
jgi:hypothetical protein